MAWQRNTEKWKEARRERVKSPILHLLLLILLLLLSFLFCVFLVVVVIVSLYSCMLEHLECISLYHMASFWYGETHAIFASFGHPARPQTRPEQLIDNTVDAIKFAWRPSLFASPLFPAVLAAEAKSRKVSSSPDCVRWWWDGTRGKEDDIKKEICNSFHLSLFLPLFCDSILSRLLPSKEKKK